MKYSVCLCKMSLKWVFLRLACLFDHQVSNFSLRLLVTTCVSGYPGLKLKNPPGYWKVSRTFRCDAFLWNTYRWLMHVTSISHHDGANRESQLTARRIFHMTTSLGVQQRKRCLWLFLPVSQAVKHFYSFLYYLITLKKQNIRFEFTFVELFWWLHVGEWWRTRCRWHRHAVTCQMDKKKQFLNGTQNSRNKRISVVRIWQTIQNTLVMKAKINWWINAWLTWNVLSECQRRGD